MINQLGIAVGSPVDVQLNSCLGRHLYVDYVLFGDMAPEFLSWHTDVPAFIHLRVKDSEMESNRLVCEGLIYFFTAVEVMLAG